MSSPILYRVWQLGIALALSVFTCQAAQAASCERTVQAVVNASERGAWEVSALSGLLDDMSAAKTQREMCQRFGPAERQFTKLLDATVETLRHCDRLQLDCRKEGPPRDLLASCEKIRDGQETFVRAHDTVVRDHNRNCR